MWATTRWMRRIQAGSRVNVVAEYRSAAAAAVKVGVEGGCTSW